MQILSKYKVNGSFDFKAGDRLASHCKSIPNEPGVYLIYILKKSIRELVYVGASGKMNQDGTFKKQKLKMRLQNMQNSKLRREKHFIDEIKRLKLDSICVEWYVTYFDNLKDLPLNIEGTILQSFVDEFKVLPKWNNQA